MSYTEEFPQYKSTAISKEEVEAINPLFQTVVDKLALHLEARNKAPLYELNEKVYIDYTYYKKQDRYQREFRLNEVSYAVRIRRRFVDLTKLLSFKITVNGEDVDMLYYKLIEKSRTIKEVITKSEDIVSLLFNEAAEITKAYSYYTKWSYTVDYKLGVIVPENAILKDTPELIEVYKKYLLTEKAIEDAEKLMSVAQLAFFRLKP